MCVCVCVCVCTIVYMCVQTCLYSWVCLGISCGDVFAYGYMCIRACNYACAFVFKYVSGLSGWLVLVHVKHWWVISCQNHFFLFKKFYSFNWLLLFDNNCLHSYYIYPTPPLGQDMTQGQWAEFIRFEFRVFLLID